MPNIPFKRYIVDVYGTESSGQYATTRTEGDDAVYINNYKELDALSEAITAGSVFLQSNISEQNQIRYVEMIGSNLADTILCDEATTMVFDPDPRYAYDGVLSPRNALQSGDCTYILKHVQYPTLYKVGYTSDLFKRTEKLYQENNKLPVHLIAFFKTTRNVELETYLHMAFASNRRMGEWFKYEPVDKWINFYKAGIKVEVKQNNTVIDPYVW